MTVWLWVGAGGFVGAILRYLVSGWIQGNQPVFPLGKLGVNFIGSLLLGTVMYLSEFKGVISEETRLFLCIGLLGAFTTMSTFGYESFRLLEQGQWALVGANIVASVGLALFGVYLGRTLALQF